MRYWALLGLAAAMAFLGSACAVSDENGGAYFISFNQVPDDSCQVQAGGGQAIFRSSGDMDLAITNTYEAFLVVNNVMPTIEEITGSGPEELLPTNNNIQIIGAEVSYLVPEGIEVPQDQFVFGGVSVEPGAQTILNLQLVPPLIGEFLRASPVFMDTQPYAFAQIVALITLEGRLQDGSSIKSRQFAYPIDVCRGCLITYPVDPEFCCDTTFWPQEFDTICFPGQDQSITCQFCCAMATTTEETESCRFDYR